MHSPELFAAPLDEPLADPAESEAGSQAPWAARWKRLAETAGIAPGESLLVALSGGADSMLLLELVNRARPRHPLLAVHVQHGLRGEESAEDERFCREVCAALGVQLCVRTIALDPSPAGLEARAREARYAVLAEEARASGHRTILTAHHADDALETLLLRWTRGAHPAGWNALRARRALRRSPGTLPDVQVVRPLLAMRRDELRAWARDAGLQWREDSSNGDLQFARNRVRMKLLPEIERAGGPLALENLRAFACAALELESSLQRATAHLTWSPPRFANARRPSPLSLQGGSLPREAIMDLSPALRRRALARLLTEGTGATPGRAVLDRLACDLTGARAARHQLTGGWTLELRSKTLELVPPALFAVARFDEPPTATALLPFPAPLPISKTARLVLSLPGCAELLDGRRITAELLHRAPQRPVPRSTDEVELDADALRVRELCVRHPRPGDRFHPFGAPGSKPLHRFLSDACIPRSERAAVPLVECDGEIVWVAGVRPAERFRVTETTRLRLRLSLLARSAD